MSWWLGKRRRILDRLGVRLGFVLSMALLPVGLLAVLQARSLMNEARARSEAALMGETLRAVSPELRLIRQGQGASEVLAAIMRRFIATNRTDCGAAMGEAVNASEVYTYAAFVAPDGSIVCSSDGAKIAPIDLSGISKLPAPPDVTLLSTRKTAKGESTGLAALHPVEGMQGEHAGYTLVNMPHSRLMNPENPPQQTNNFALVLFDKDGRILSASRESGDPTALLPADRSLVSLTQQNFMTFTGPDTSGVERAFSVMKLVDAGLFALGSWPASQSSWAILRNLPAILFPLLMWAACLIAAWLAAESMVTTYVRRLRRAIVDFSGGRRRVVDLDMTGAPVEMREAAEAFERMTDAILHDEAELENSLHQKEVLLREVHHRVKNNLQLIASIMNMQMRKTKSIEAKFLMKGLQDRVMSLATIHKGLYQTSGQADIRVNELFPEIVSQIIRMTVVPERRFDVSTNFDDLNLTPDQAVPLALLLTEALTNAVKYTPHADGDGPNAALRVSLKRTDGGSGALVIENSSSQLGVRDEETDEGGGLGTQLINAFVRQLGGTLDREIDERTYRLRVIFPLRELSEAEQRRRASDDTEAAAE